MRLIFLQSIFGKRQPRQARLFLPNLQLQRQSLSHPNFITERPRQVCHHLLLRQRPHQIPGTRLSHPILLLQQRSATNAPVVLHRRQQHISTRIPAIETAGRIEGRR